MKTTLTYLLPFLILLLASCESDREDFISKYCPGSCTVIKGRITTANGTRPLAQVKLSLNWQSDGYMNSDFRKKAVTVTDADGYYELRFLVRDDEYEYGTYMVQPDVGIDSYVQCGNYNLPYFSYHKLERNTTIQANYNYAEKAFIEFRFNNRESMQSGDRLLTRYVFAFREQEGEACNRTILWNDTGSNSITAQVAADQPVVIQHVKVKGGVETVEETTIELAPGETAVQIVAF